MSRRRLTVLKLGGSVLPDESSLRAAASEIYRFRAQGDDLVVVVSALAGRTDELLVEAGRLAESSAWSGLAARVSLGEWECATALSCALERIGLPSCVLGPGSLELRAEGEALSAEPVSLDRTAIDRAHERSEVVLVPGYCALDASGRTVLLGRGGSDSTALFLASRLDADRCRLLKDVDGLYTGDPRREQPRPARYAAATWEDALATDGTILQHAAVQLARREERGFELGRLGGTRPTRLGVEPHALEGEPDLPRKLSVALLGLGTVGGGVLEHLLARSDEFELVRVATRDPQAPRDPRIPLELLTTDALEAATCGADVVVEAIGGARAWRWIEAALTKGSRVVSANKTGVAAAPPREVLSALPDRLRVSAAVGGSLPLIEQLDDDVFRVRGLLNGTSNFLLDRLDGETSFENCVRLAQRAGYAEADPSKDLDGRDAAEKLVVLARHLGDASLSVADVPRDTIEASTVDRCVRAASRGLRLRQVATLEREGGDWTACVRLEELDAKDPLASGSGVSAVATVERTDGSRTTLHGKGAGRWPTAEAVLSDLLTHARALGEVQGARNTMSSPSRVVSERGVASECS